MNLLRDFRRQDGSHAFHVSPLRDRWAVVIVGQFGSSVRDLSAGLGDDSHTGSIRPGRRGWFAGALAILSLTTTVSADRLLDTHFRQRTTSRTSREAARRRIRNTHRHDDVEKQGDRSVLE